MYAGTSAVDTVGIGHCRLPAPHPKRFGRIPHFYFKVFKMACTWLIAFGPFAWGRTIGLKVQE